MIFFKRRRLVVWLLKAYLRRWGRILLVSFSIGLLFFILLFLNRGFILSKIPFSQTKSVGLIGSYYVQDLPSNVLDMIGEGLTTVDLDGVPKPGLAKAWKIQDSGKTYIFQLRDDVKFSNGDKFTSEDVNYNFQDVQVERPGKYSIVFRLKAAYSPFLVTVSQKIFKKNYIGTGNYRFASLKLNGGYVQSVEVEGIKTPEKRIKYQFYPTEEALKIAFSLGEVDEIRGVNSTKFGTYDFAKFKNVYLKKSTDYKNLVTIFFNTQDPDLSDKNLRKALSYAIPNEFSEGKRNYTSLRPTSWASTGASTLYIQDLEHSKLLLKEAEASGSAKLTIHLKTLSQYKEIAGKISNVWNSLGVKTVVEEVSSVPSAQEYEVFLGDFFVPRDPDQYSLWHSNQSANLTNYKNLRIDKLLEDGRTISNTSERRSIYSDFEKYLLDDAPAAFVLFPTAYTISRIPF